MLVPGNTAVGTSFSPRPLLENTTYPVLREIRHVRIECTNSNTSRLSSTGSHTPFSLVPTSINQAEPTTSDFLRFEFGSSDDAVHSLARNDPFYKILQKAIDAGLEEIGAYGAVVTKELPVYRLAAPRKRSQLITAVDFKEFAFRLNGALVLARASIDFDPVVSPVPDRKNSSAKLAIRFLLAEHPASRLYNQHAIDLPDAAITEFARCASLLADRALTALHNPFERYIRETSGQQDLHVKDHLTHSLFLIGTHDKGFNGLLEGLKNGQGPSEYVERNPVAERLLTLGHQVLCSGTTQNVDIASRRLEMRAAGIRYTAHVDPSERWQGIMLYAKHGNRIRFAGIAREFFIPPPTMENSAARIVSSSFAVQSSLYL